MVDCNPGSQILRLPRSLLQFLLPRMWRSRMLLRGDFREEFSGKIRQNQEPWKGFSQPLWALLPELPGNEVGRKFLLGESWGKKSLTGLRWRKIGWDFFGDRKFPGGSSNFSAFRREIRRRIFLKAVAKWSSAGFGKGWSRVRTCPALPWWGTWIKQFTAFINVYPTVND